MGEGKPMSICTVRVPTSDFPGPCGRAMPCPVHTPEASANARLDDLLNALTEVPHGHTFLLRLRAASGRLGSDSEQAKRYGEAVKQLRGMGLIFLWSPGGGSGVLKFTATGEALMNRWLGEGE